MIDLERWGTVSSDNGATWSNAQVISDVVSPKPLQPDPNVQACYTGDYDRSYSNTANHYSAWVDGRVLVGGASQQNVFFDKVAVGPPPPPAPNLVHDLTTLFDDGDGIIEPGESFGLDERIRNAGNARRDRDHRCADTSTPGITITTANSAYPNLAPGANGTNATRFMANASAGLTCGGVVNFTLALTTAQGPFNVNFSVPKEQCGYQITTQTGQPIIPGTVNIGNSGDDIVTPITFPFPVTIYGQSFSAGTASSNGNLQIGSSTTAYSNDCLPTTMFETFLSPYWDDLHTGGATEGIFTALTGSPPNRQFIIEWRTHYFSGAGTANFEIIFTEGSGIIRYRYGVERDGGLSATIGIQESMAVRTSSRATPHR